MIKALKNAVILGGTLILFSTLTPEKSFSQDTLSDKGIGPVKSVTLGPVDEELAEVGKATFQAKCSACHKIEERYVGPALSGVTKRRSPEWIMNMILNPQEMTQKNQIAQDLFGEYLVQMTFQNVSEKDARAILEYFRKVG